MATNEVIDFNALRLPCMGEFLVDPEKGIWQRCWVHGAYQRGSGASVGQTLQLFWGVTDIEGNNHEINGFKNVRFTIHRDSA